MYGKKNKGAVLCAASLALAAGAGAFEGEEIRLREGGASDGVVRITRVDGRIVFHDADHPGGITLAGWLESGGDHGALSGLDGDDHAQYLNAGRHLGEHTAGFNAALHVPPDVAGNATLGGHLADASIHLDASGGETVTGAWHFAPGLSVGFPGLVLFPGVDATPFGIAFDDAPFDASILYDPVDRVLSVNRTLQLQALRATSGDLDALAVRASLDGRVEDVPTATLEGFASIEGIAPSALADLSADETVTGAWTFEAPVVSEVETTASGTGILAASSRSLADTSVASLPGATGLVVGHWGEARSTVPGVAAAGLVGTVTGDTTAARSAGVFGAANSVDAETLAGLPDGAWAAGFAGDVWISGHLVEATPALLVANGDDEALLEGDVVAWAGVGLVRRADAATSWTGPVAGIALAAAAPGASLAIATGGLVSVRTQGDFDAGEALGWDGAKAAASTPGDPGIVGVAVAAESPGPTRLVTIQLRPGFSP